MIKIYDALAAVQTNKLLPYIHIIFSFPVSLSCPLTHFSPLDFRFGECSQICNIKKDGNHTCSCAPGFSLHSYSQKQQKSCSADGNLAYMVVANDHLLQKMSPYKNGNSAGTLPLFTVLVMLVCNT